MLFLFRLAIIVIIVAHEVGDSFAKVGIAIDGLKQRDRLVFQAAKARGIPVMVTYAGGYARRVEDTVTIHCNTVLAAKEIFAG